MGMIGARMTLAGGMLLAITGLIDLFGYRPDPWLSGLAALVLGIGLVLFSNIVYQRLQEATQQVELIQAREERRERKERERKKEEAATKE